MGDGDRSSRGAAGATADLRPCHFCRHRQDCSFQHQRQCFLNNAAKIVLETEMATVSLYGDCCYAPRDLLVGLRSRIGPGAVIASHFFAASQYMVCSWKYISRHEDLNNFSLRISVQRYFCGHKFLSCSASNSLHCCLSTMHPVSIVYMLLLASTTCAIPVGHSKRRPPKRPLVHH